MRLVEPDLPGAATFARTLMSERLGAHLTYHTADHTAVDVLGAAERLADLEAISRHERVLLFTSVWFHDLGYTERSAGHEDVSIRIAREVLPDLGYSPTDVDIVEETMEATRLPQRPTSALAEMMADADLDVLGREVAWDRNRALRRELEAAGGSYTDATWLDQQIAFVQGHRYFRATARTLRDGPKARYLEELLAARAAL